MIKIEEGLSIPREKRERAKSTFSAWCNYLNKSYNNMGRVLDRLYFKKTRIVLLFGNTELPYKTPEELTMILELEEQRKYKEWFDIVGLNYDEVPEV